PAGRRAGAVHALAHALRAPAPDPQRRRPAQAGGEGVWQGPRGFAGEARAEPTDLRAVRRLAEGGRARESRRVAMDPPARSRRDVVASYSVRWVGGYDVGGGGDDRCNTDGECL